MAKKLLPAEALERGRGSKDADRRGVVRIQSDLRLLADQLETEHRKPATRAFWWFVDRCRRSAGMLFLEALKFGAVPSLWAAPSVQQAANLSDSTPHDADSPNGDTRHEQVFESVRVLLPSLGFPSAEFGFEMLNSIRAFADLIGKLPPDQQPVPKGVSRFDAALLLQGINRGDQDDVERSRAAFDMSRRWGKIRTITWPRLIGFDPKNGQAHMYNAGELADVIAKVEPVFVTQLGGPKDFAAKLKQCEHDPLPATSITARTLPKSQNSSVAIRRGKSRRS